MGFDTDKIYQDANCLEVARMLGIRMKRRGSTTYIACPEHFERAGKADTKIDKCSCNEKGYYCFSCGAKGSAIKLVQKTLNCSFKEAAERVVATLPDPDSYVDRKTKRPGYKPFPLSDEQVEALGLQKRVYLKLPNNMTYDKQELTDSGYEAVACCVDEKDTVYYVSGSTATYSLQSLFEEDPALFNFMIKNKAEEMAERYDRMLNSRFVGLFAGDIIGDETVWGVENKLKKWRRICQKLAVKYAAA